MSTTISRDNPMQTLRTLTRILDEAITVPGTRFRFGLDAIIGLIPGVGDLAGAAMSGFTLLIAYRVGASPMVLLHMLLNIGVDTLVGMVPLLGDIFDFGFKSTWAVKPALARFSGKNGP